MTRQPRSDPAVVTALKTIHTIIFAGELAAILWLVVSGLVGRRDRSVRVATAAVGTEAIVFVANGGVCPITPLTERFGAANGSVSDIFLPDCVARTIPIWSTALIALAVVLHARRRQLIGFSSGVTGSGATGTRSRS